MEKLIKLLNEYSKLKEERYLGEEWQPIRTRKEYELEYPIERIRIISKPYWFIKRLVEKNKIDIERLHKIVDYRLEIKENYLNAHDYNSDLLLMLLSISSTPIEDLISYLR